MCFWERGMTILQIEIEEARPVSASCDEANLNIVLADGRMLRSPLWWYPGLNSGSLAARNMIEFMPMGLHWPELDEDISVASVLRGQKAPGARDPACAKA